jgi:DNA-directed RNA polymerase subunit F
MKKLGLLFIGLLITIGVYSQTEVSGTIAANTTWSGTILVTGNVTLNQFITLTIQPGTVIKFGGKFSIIINGTLVCNGTQTNKILFTSNQGSPQPGDWGGITFSSQSGYPASSISHCEFLYATTVLNFVNVALENENNVSSCLFDNISDRGIRVEGSKVNISGCTFRNFVNYGIEAFGSNANVTILNSTMTQVLPVRMHTGSGLIGYNGAKINMTGNTITRTLNAIYPHANNDVKAIFNLNNNTLTENKRGFYVNPSGYNYPEIIANFNNIHSNTDWNVFIEPGRNPRLTELNFENNWWGTVDGNVFVDKIYDYSKANNRAFVNFLPFINNPFGSGGTSTSSNYIANWIKEDFTIKQTSSPLVVLGALIVAPYITLTIEPGVILKFKSYNITIDGALVCNGTQTNKIVFTSNQPTPQPGDWGGITFSSQSGYPASSISHCEFHYPTIALNFVNILTVFETNISSCLFDNISDRGIRVEGSKVNISGCTFRNFVNYGIEAFGSNANVTILNSTMTQVLPVRMHTGSGLIGYNGAKINMTGNTITRTLNAIYPHANNDVKAIFNLNNNTLTENKRGFYVNPSGYNYPEIIANFNNIHSNTDWNVFIEPGRNPRLTELNFENNWWGTVDGNVFVDKIYDYSKANNRAFVNFLPFINNPFGSGGTSTSSNYIANWIKEDFTIKQTSSPLVVLGALIVAPYITLTIEPGVILKFKSYNITIDGALVCNGTQTNKIVFTSNQPTPQPGDWGGITFSSQSGYPASSISHCEFHYPTIALNFVNILTVFETNISSCLFDNISDRGIRVEGSKVNISGCTFRNFVNYGIEAFGSNANVTILNSTMTQVLPVRMHTGSGLIGYNGAKINMTGNTITRTLNAIYPHANNDVKAIFNLNNNTLTENKRGFYVNPSGYNYPEIIANFNNIHSNTDWNVFIEPGRNPRLTELNFENNWWGTVDGNVFVDKIYDYSKANNRAFVNFLPFINNPFGSGGTSTSSNYIANWIKEDFTIKQTSSPLVVLGALIVAPYITLTIEPGVILKFKSYNITIDGALVCNGTQTNKIVFTSNQPTPQPGDWGGITFSSQSGYPASSISHCEFHYPTIALNFVNILTVFETNISSCLFDNISDRGIRVEGSKVNISGCTFRNFVNYGIEAFGSNANVTILNSTMTQVLPVRMHTGSGLIGYNGAKINMTGNTITRTLNAIYPHANNDVKAIFNLNNNTLTENKRGFYVNSGGWNYPEIIANFNNIHSNTDWNVFVEPGRNPATTELNFENNWWNSLDSDTIKLRIYDYSNLTNRAKVKYVPYLLEPPALIILPADFNSDGAVNGFDLAIFAVAFGTTPASPKWNEKCDLNKSGQVDGFDLAIFASYFGQTSVKSSETHPYYALAQLKSGKVALLNLEADISQIKSHEEFSVFVRATDISDAITLAFNVNYDHRLFELIEIERHHDIKGGPNTIFMPFIDQNKGYGMVALASLDNQINGLSGSGIVCELKFRAKEIELPTAFIFSQTGLVAMDGTTKLGLRTTDLKLDLTTGLQDNETMLSLDQNYPNPFAGKTTIGFNVPAGYNAPVNLSVYNLQGQKVATLFEGSPTTGYNTFEFNRTAVNGQRLPGGIYFFTLRSGEMVLTRKMVITEGY